MQTWQHIYIFVSILSISLKNLKRKIEGVYARSERDFCKVSVLKKIIKPPLLHIPEVAENSKMAILFFPLILVLNDPFLRAGSPWSLSLDAAISTAATGSPVPEHNLSLSSISWAIWLRIHVFMDARWWKQTDTGLEKDPNLLILTSGSTSDLQTQTRNKPSVYICLFQFPQA